MKTFLTTLFITAALTSLSPAQTITVTSDNYLNSIGTTITHISGEVDTVQTPTVDAGSPGENKTWDFRNIVFSDTTFLLTQQNLAPQQTAYADSFPDANYTSHITGKAITPSDTIEVLTFNSTSYYKVTPSSAILLGQHLNTFFGDTLEHAHDTTFLPISHTFGETWTTIEKDTVWGSLFGSTMITSITNDSTVNTIDAYGTIKLPLGDFECVRVKNNVTSTDYEIFSGTQTVTNIEYSWKSKEGLLLASVTSQDNETNPDFTNPSSFSRLESINGSTVAIKDKKNQPHGFKLTQNYPNPFNPTTKISFTIPKQSHVVLTVYNSLGQKIATLVNGVKQSGSYEVTFDASNLSSGIYLYRLKTGQNILTRKMLLLK